MNKRLPAHTGSAGPARASRWALLFERLWPRIWLVLGLVGIFLLASLAGLWPLLSDPAHYLLLAAFTLAAIAAVVHAARAPFPTHDEGVRRIERVSGVPHRPASSYEDTITANADDPRTAVASKARIVACMLLISSEAGRPLPETSATQIRWQQMPSEVLNPKAS